MPREERRIELAQIRNGPDGPTRIAALYAEMLQRTGLFGTPGILVDGMVEQILAIEFPDEADPE